MKNLPKIIAFAVLILFITSCKKSKGTVKTDSNGYHYETVDNDPTGLRLYTLDNGLKVYLSKNSDEPKIQTFIGVRAGSVYDPVDNTGLAHYLEHMVFKGTDKFGTQNFEEEEKLLNRISDLYEDHKAEKDPAKKKEIYKVIDSVSYEASKVAIANEYDKMVSSLGSEGTNAWTWHEETVYTNKIPSNELEKWLSLESERFRKLVLRLFHTELEAVYEEFNRSQDSDFRKAHYMLLDGLFPTHPYGQQSTIGKSEHLKNPSMEAIHNYFNTYYVPNNIAMVLVGDIDFEKTIQKVDASFGKFESKEVTHPERPTESPITDVITKEVFGPEAARVSLGFRADGVGSKQEKLVTLIDMIMNNSEAGLIDLNLNQKQLVQRAGSSPTFFNDYGYYSLWGIPKSDQTLEDVKDLLLEQIEKLKSGDFEEWMIDAVINDLKLSQIKSYENASSLANEYIGTFTQFQNWADRVSFLDELKEISKEDLVAFANEFFKENYVVVYKRQGESTDLVKVDKPKITPIELNRDQQSAFSATFYKKESPAIEPQYVNYKEAIQKNKTKNGVEVSYVQNKLNDLAELNFIFDMGKEHFKKLPHAVSFLEYLGTDKYKAEEIKKEFYKLGISYGVNTGNDRSTIYLSGLRENMDKGLELFTHLIENAVADEEAYKKYVQKIGKSREDSKANKRNILFGGLTSYAMYGEDSSFRDRYSLEELNSINPNELVELIKGLKNYKHQIFYYGKDLDQALNALNKHHNVAETFKEYPEKKEYARNETGDHVYFVDYDMVQSELVLLSKADEFSPDLMAETELFNTYFGAGLSSIVFQEIRESKSLAYSAYSFYSNASKKEDPNYIYAYIGTQANKLSDAVNAMTDLMNNMPEAKEQFNAAKNATLKKIAAERITKTSVFWRYEQLKKLGIENDNREAIYNKINKMTLADLKSFFDTNIKGRKYTSLVVGNKKDLDLEALKKLGEVKELDVDFLFNDYQKSTIKH